MDDAEHERITNMIAAQPALLREAAQNLHRAGLKPPYLLNGIPNYVAPNVIVGLKPGPGSLWVNEFGELVEGTEKP